MRRWRTMQSGHEPLNGMGVPFVKLHGRVYDATNRSMDGHPDPWRAEPAGDGTWVVYDVEGATVATGMRQSVADLLVELPDAVVQAVEDFEERTYDYDPEDDTSEECEREWAALVVDHQLLELRTNRYPEAIPD